MKIRHQELLRVLSYDPKRLPPHPAGDVRVIRMLQGDCRDVLRTLPDESVHCVVTSPPYWGLRDYGVAGQIGLEPSFTNYIDTMTAVFHEVRRVLRKDGTLWLNMGDCYAGPRGGKSNFNQGFNERSGNASGQKKQELAVTVGLVERDVPEGLKPKDLCGIPWRVAFALQADGWYLRSDIIWSKKNPMPESCTDRPTKAHEYLFLMSKSERYYYDAEAIKEPTEWSAKMPDGWDTGEGAHGTVHRSGREKGQNNGAGGNSRNRRTVWEIATSPFPEAHFATFPPALVEPCILAGCPQKCCAKCGAPWVRKVEREITGRAETNSQLGDGIHVMSSAKSLATKRQAYRALGLENPPASKTIGFSPSCSCGPLSVMGGISYAIAPGTVLDPFGGAGTTGLVADRLGHNAILIELNPKYAEMAERRLRDDAGMFAMVAAE